MAIRYEIYVKTPDNLQEIAEYITAPYAGERATQEKIEEVESKIAQEILERTIISVKAVTF